MKLSNRQSGVFNFVARTIETVIRKGAIRVTCKNADVADKLVQAANVRRIFVVRDGLNLTLAKGK